MTFAFVLVALWAAVNAPRIRPTVPEDQAVGRARADVLLLGSIAILALAVLGIALSDELLDVLDISPESWRIAAGLILALVGLRYLAFPGPAEEPALRGRLSALVPVTFPLLLTPELFVLVVLFGATESAGAVVAALAIALAALNVIGLMRRIRPALWRAAAQFHGAVLVVVAIALVIEGIRDV